ncbi:MAG: type I restriction endonuclease subunit R, partial [Methylomonas sp.]
KPITANEAEPSDREKEFIRQIIARMNDLFGDISDDIRQWHFTAQIVDIAKQNHRVAEQVEHNTKEQALQGDLPEVVNAAKVDAMKSHNDLARVILKYPQNMEVFFNLVYDIMKHGAARNLLE